VSEEQPAPLSKKQTAAEVIAEAIDAMRRDSTASGAADAIEKASRGSKFDVDLVVREISASGAEKETAIEDHAPRY